MNEVITTELINVTKTFKGLRGSEVLAVDDISLSVCHGEFFSLLGPSGCGKSTTLRLIAGFEFPTNGQVKILGHVMNDTPAYRRRVNMVFQNYALFPHMTVEENIAFGLRMERVEKNEIKKRVAEALELVQLAGLESRKPKKLSGGQQQRVALARALIKKPALLLLDEPLGALDKKLRKAMQLELKHMQQSLGITFIYVTHDQEEAITMSNMIAVMNNGKVLQVGSPMDIYEHPSCKFVADFIGESNFIKGIIKELDTRSLLIEIGETISITLPNQGKAFSNGDRVAIMIRPERGILNKKIPKEKNLCAIPGRLLETLYLGNDIVYVVNIDDTQKATIRSQNVGNTSLFGYQIGDLVNIICKTDDITIFKETGQNQYS